MPALKLTDFTCRITWLGRVADRGAALTSAPVESLAARFDGPEGEAHGGIDRPSCSRVLHLHPRDTTIRNVRQFSILSVEELAHIAATMGIVALRPEWLGATMVVEGLEDFSHLPPSSRLQGPDGVTLVVDMANRPCHLPARVIDDHLPGVGKRFKTAAKGRRGVTAWVEREGRLSVGEELRLAIPDQPVWAPLEMAGAPKSAPEPILIK
ncbi:MOSC domain protein [Pseudooceanicola batsensis HTCC2597]|uniref:MOSC domain protein n=1 Tax=Pseudooceanicola batsensis (strain ATCC BAA-863 / DSM 15984 / KCTC 12145 / HTCC2597) TaxID=252305 RepID=A3TZ20_PSEBH|nr:MOSC domain-containing protein [Pseudooceanicola batsensis]EAQ02838.1 MOSC domain protein [Pseudooceanicola batsensis HTCC2597]